MKKKDKEARRTRRQASANVFVAGSSSSNSDVTPVSSRRHVPSRQFKNCQQVADRRKREASKRKWQSSIKIRTSSNLMVVSVAILMLCGWHLSRATESLPSSSPVIVWNQPLIIDGSEWRPIVATPVDVSNNLMRRSGSSNGFNTTEDEQVLAHITREPVYLPTSDLLADTERQVPLNQSITALGSDQAVAESSPRQRGGRVRSEEPEILLDEQSIQKVIPVRKGKKSTEEESPPAGQFDDDEGEPVRQSGPGERRLTTPMRSRQPVAPAGNQGDSSVDIALVQSAAKRPPVYMSAPKHISELSEMNKRASAVAQAEHSKKTSDLNTAAGHYKSKRKKGKKKKKKKKKKVYKVKKYKKKKKKSKKKKKKKVTVVVKKKMKRKKKNVKKSKPVYHHHHHHYEPKHKHHGGGGGGGHHHHHHPHQHHHEHGKYYEYRSVPKKGAWEFGYKRGNKKHTISRKEHGHKSHFKTKVEWKDKKGKGQHVFDYNHGDHHKHDHHHAVATKTKPAKVAPKGADNNKKIS